MDKFKPKSERIKFLQKQRGKEKKYLWFAAIPSKPLMPQGSGHEDSSLAKRECNYRMTIGFCFTPDTGLPVLHMVCILSEEK